MNKKVIHKDYFDQELNVGDKVVYIDRYIRNFQKGEITKLNAKLATIIDDLYDDKAFRSYNSIIKI